MRNSIFVLDSLASKSTDKSYKYKKLYRNLYNPDFFLRAYSLIYANTGNMTEGSDKMTIDAMSLERINSIIEKIKDESYQPTPVRRVYIPKKNGKKRPLGIPSIDDKLVQVVIRDILQAIYEGTFAEESHGYRPNKSCHTALTHIKDRFNGTKWFVEGDIKGFFNNINHHTLINILKKRIEDEKFIRLIWKFLRAGYMENWKFHNSYSGTPQGGIISPILSNIYLNELDNHILEFKESFDKGMKKATNKEWEKVNNKIKKLNIKLKNKVQKGKLKEGEKEEILSEIKKYSKIMYSLPSKDPMDADYKRLQYVRYADDFLIGVIGSKKDAEVIKQNLAEFLLEKLNLELSEEKTLITNASKMVRFLGYDITISKNQNLTSIQGDKRGTKSKARTASGKVALYLPKDKWLGKLSELNVIKIEGNNWKPTHRKYLTNFDDLEILSTYNAEIRGMYNYYKLALNVSVLQKFSYFMEYSMYKTFANKYRTSMAKVITKYKKNGVFTIEFNTKKGKGQRNFYNEGFKRDTKLNSKHENFDLPVNVSQYQGRNGLISRLKAEKCEWCGKDKVQLEIHHVRKLKDLKGKKLWEKAMIARNRKTLALCATGQGNDCHRKLHAGLLD